ncbi:MAG: amidohydrolase [Actinomycetia bacterium]|nr:amidohydrolase [Actinomycetes bacterium]
MVDLRRRIHQEPELGLDLPLTQAKVLESLDGLPLTIETGEATTSVVATLEGGGDGPTILLRGDMDALPMPEHSGEPFASRFDGRMHACGHDSHVAMLAGAARILSARRETLNGRVKFMFQPGEEGYAGAKVMIEEGVLDSPAVDAAFAVHISPNVAAGSVASRAGSMMASADTFKLTVMGKGGHASMPYGAVDPIPVACEIVQAFQTMVTRTINAFDPAVLTVAHIEAGTTSNVIPESAFVEGTLRTVSEATRARAKEGIVRVAQNVAAAHGCTVEVDLSDGYPVTVNDADMYGFAVDVARHLLGPDQVAEMPAPVMGAEDWSYVLQKVPGAIFFLGVCPDGDSPSQAHACHSNKMRIHESAMINGASLYSAVAVRYLEKGSLA